MRRAAAAWKNVGTVFTFNSSNSFAFPVQAQLGFGDPEIDGNNNELGIYAQDDWSPTDRFTINAGIRWDHYRLVVDESALSPRLGVAWSWPAADLVVRASYDRAFQTPAPAPARAPRRARRR